MAPDNEYVKLFYIVELLKREHPHLPSCMLTDAGNVGLCEHGKILLCLTHSIGLDLYAVSLVAVAYQTGILPHGRLIKKFLKSLTSTCHICEGQRLFNKENLVF